MRRIASHILAPLAFLTLMGLAVSCGEEQPSGGAQQEEEKPAQQAEESARKAPAEKPKPEEAEKPKPKKTEAENPKKVEEPEVAQLPAEAGEVAEAAGDQYGAVTARQYEEEQPEQEAEEAQYEEGEQAEEAQYEAEEAEGEEVAAAAPSDPTMYLSVPALGISGTPVIDENSEAALTAGTMHLPGTGFPWQEGANVYIAGHRVGYPGTPSDRIFFDLPSISMGDEVVLTDANGEAYSYAVSEMFAVTPFDTWVTGPTGTDTVTLQVCTETPDDWFTIGPKLMSSGPESGRLIVRAARLA